LLRNADSNEGNIWAAVARRRFQGGINAAFGAGGLGVPRPYSCDFNPTVLTTRYTSTTASSSLRELDAEQPTVIARSADGGSGSRQSTTFSNRDPCYFSRDPRLKLIAAFRFIITEHGQSDSAI
jgi:hypothetical protein